MGSGVWVDTPSDLCRHRSGQEGQGPSGVGESMNFYFKKNCDAPQPESHDLAVNTKFK